MLKAWSQSIFADPRDPCLSVLELEMGSQPAAQPRALQPETETELLIAQESK